MVYRECPKVVVSMPDRPFPYPLKAGVLLSLNVHRDKGLCLGDAVRTAIGSKSGFSFSLLEAVQVWSQDCGCT